MELTKTHGRGHGTGYQPTPLEDIDYWYKQLPREGIMQRTFVDVGCGKGVVLRHWRERAAQDGWWPTLVGIESDWLLSALAWRRIARLNSRVYTTDATTFNYAALDSPLLVWLFNPFGSQPMSLLLDKLQGLDVWVVANNVQHVAAMQDCGYELRAYWWRGEQENAWFWLSNGGTA